MEVICHYMQDLVFTNYYLLVHRSFWCFPYERMNGILAGTPNSNRCIEIEVANRFVKDISFGISDLPYVHFPNVPDILKQFVCSHDYDDDDDVQISPYPLTFWVLSLGPTDKI